MKCLNYKFVFFISIVLFTIGCKKKNHWYLTNGPESNTSPAIVGYKKDGNIYVASVNLEGEIFYSKTGTPDSWTSWNSIGTSPGNGFAKETSPVLISSKNKDELRIYARGSDNNLYRSIKTDLTPWSNWKLIINDNTVKGRINVTLTWNSPDAIPEEHIVYVSNTSCNYYRIVQGSSIVKKVWEGGLEGVITGNNEDEIGIVLRYENKLEFKKIKKRDAVLEGVMLNIIDGFNQPQFPSTWNITIDKSVSLTSFSISSLILFNNSYHIIFSNKYRFDDVGSIYSYHLKHAWFNSNTGNIKLRNVNNYTFSNDKHPLPNLTLYRNKLLAAWTATNGSINTARWDNADPELPWITRYGNTGNTTSRYMPSITSFNHRGYIPAGDMDSPHYGNDSYAIISGNREKGKPEFINISREMMRKDISRELTIYNSQSDNMNPVCRPPSDPFGPLKVNNIWTDDRVVISEIGFNFWAFPDWIIRNIYTDFTNWMCTSPNGKWQDGQTPCQTSRLPVYIKKSGGIFNCGGAWINQDNTYIRIWEELGHYFSPVLGLGTALSPQQEFADISGISLQQLNLGRQIFIENTGTCTSGPRCTGFTGIGGNYDNGGVEHSFMYTIYYYIFKGDEIRQFINQDLSMGSDLLQRKYNWVKLNIFRGLEYRNDLEPI